MAVAKIAGLEQFYGVSDQRGLAFFQAHLQADRFHADTARQILREQITPDNTDEVVTACEDTLTALWGRLGRLRPLLLTFGLSYSIRRG